MDFDLDAARKRHRTALKRLHIIEAEHLRATTWIAALEELWEAAKELQRHHEIFERIADGAIRSWNLANPM